VHERSELFGYDQCLQPPTVPLRARKASIVVPVLSYYRPGQSVVLGSCPACTIGRSTSLPCNGASGSDAMILAVAMLFFQFPAVMPAASAPQPPIERPVIESRITTSSNALESANAANTLETAAAVPVASSKPDAQPPAPIVEPPTSFLSPGIYEPPPPQLLLWDQPPVTHRALWLVLSAAEHGSATYDAWSTRRALETGRVEADPIMRPFAGSPAIYGAIQIIPIGLDYLARRLQRSSGWARHVWWAPQSLATATFLFSGSYNVSHTTEPSRP
jgi:hypothetical protein